MKPSKHFVKHVATDGAGRIVESLVLTPPLETQEQAEAYRVWYEKSPLRRVLVEYVDFENMPKLVQHVCVAFETTLY